MGKRVENGEWEARRKGVEGLQRSRGMGFLTGRDFVKWKGNSN